jgi:hypothetical protein
MMRRMSPAARRLFLLLPGCCRWPSEHDLEDLRFRWCGAPACNGRPYCADHTARARCVEDEAKR